MKKGLAMVLSALMLLCSLCVFSFPISAQESSLVAVDYTKLQTLGVVDAQALGAEAAANLQVGKPDGTDVNVIYAKDGYKPTYAVYKVMAEEGKTFQNLKLDLVGRVCDFGASDPNIFRVFIADSAAIDWSSTAAYTQETNTNGSFDQTFSYDLSAAAAGKSIVYVAFYLESHASPEWMALKSLRISGKQAEHHDVTLNVDFVDSGLPAGRLADIPNALEVLKAHKQDNMTLKVDEECALSNADGFKVGYITYKLEAGEGKEFTSLHLKLYGRMVAFSAAEIEPAWLRIYADAEDSFDKNQWWDQESEAYVEKLKLQSDAADNTDWALDHEYTYDLTEKAAGKSVVYVTIADYLETTPSRFAFSALSFYGDVKAASTAPTTTVPTTAPTTPAEPSTPTTGAVFPAAVVTLGITSVLALVFAGKRKCSH